jgi:PAS domain S-box-containing protein
VRNVEFGVPKPDGTVVWICVNSQPVRDHDGNLIGVASSLIDITERKQSEAVLKLSEERLRLAKGAAGIGIYDHDMATESINWDDRMRELWGVGADDPITFELFMSGVHPDDRATTQAAVDRALDPKGDGEYYAEYRVLPLNGAHGRWVAATGQIFFDAERPVRFVGAVLDVTERKRAEEELRKSRDELELRVRQRTAELEDTTSRLREQAALLELAHDAILVRDLDDRIVYWNSGAERTYGWRKEEALGKITHELLHTEFPKPLEEITAEVLGNLEWEGELLHRTRNGESIVVASRWAIQRGQGGAPCGFLEINRDVTERKQAEEALRESERQYRMLVETINEGLAKYNEEFLFSYVNERFCEMLGYSAGELIGRPIAKVFNEVNQVKLQEQLDRRERGEKGSYEIEFLANDGRSVPAIVSSSPVLDEHGKFKGGIATITDIIVRKQAEDALRESEKQLKRLSSQLLKVQEDERRRVACEIHDSIGQSLHALKSGVKSLNQQMRDILCSPELEEAFDDLLQMVDFSIEEVRAIYAGLRPLLLDDLGILATVGWFIRECRKTYPDIVIEAQIRILEEEVPGVLKIVIFRLLQAAMDNITRHSKANAAWISLENTAGKLELMIEDNGTGFSFEDVALEKKPGEALGIAIMQERVESSEGVFTLKTAKGQGTTIRAFWDLSRCAQ